METRPRVFRPGFESWLGRVILPAIFLIVLGVTALNLLEVNRGLMWLILAALPSLGLVAGVYALPVLLGRIVVDREGLLLHVDGMRLKLTWRTIRAVKIDRHDHEPYLVLGVESGLYILPVPRYPLVRLWEAIALFAPAEAVRSDAMAAFDQKDASEGLPPDLWLMGTLHAVDHPGMAIAAALGMAGYLALFATTLVTRQPGAPVYLTLAVLYLLNLTDVGATELDRDGITRRTLLGVQRILWDELAIVEVGPYGVRMTLEDIKGRKLSLFGPAMWTGSDAARATQFVALQIGSRRLIRRRSFLA